MVFAHAKGYIRQHKLLYYILYPYIIIRRFIRNSYTHYLLSIYQRILSRVVDGTVSINLPEYNGVFDIDVRSHILRRIALFGEYETGIRDLVIKNLDPTKDVIDVGANIGFFTVSMAKQLSVGRKVLSVEPTPGAISLFLKNIKKNQVTDSVLLYPGVVSNNFESISINIASGNEEYSTIGEKIIHESVRDLPVEKIRVECSTIDRLVEMYNLIPGLIKIDVEGAEYLVLDGAQKTLRKFSPVVVFESSKELIKNFPYTFTDIQGIFKKMNYRVIALDEKDEYLAVPLSNER
jgi:FkbM family methyltransferase